MNLGGIRSMGTIVLAMIAVRIVTAMVIVQVFVIVLLALIQQLYTVFRGKRRAPEPRGERPPQAVGSGVKSPHSTGHSLKAGRELELVVARTSPGGPDDSSSWAPLAAPGEGHGREAAPGSST